jgi:aspartate ammonia-lyase
MSGRSVAELVLEKKLLSKQRLEELLQPEVLSKPRPILEALELTRRCSPVFVSHEEVR